jgi:hypothetical protein
VQPAEEWEDGTPEKLRGKLFRYRVAIATQGVQLGGGIIKKCHEYPGLFELRVRHHKDLAREFCTIDGDRLVMLDGVVKPEGEATPVRSFTTASGYLREYQGTRKISPPEEEGQDDEPVRAKAEEKSN